MEKIKSLDDLRKKRQELESQLRLREKSNAPESLVQIKVAMATCGIAAGARAVMNTLIERTAAEALPVIVTQTGCMGYCHSEPTVEVHLPGKEAVVFGRVDARKAIDIIEKYIKRGELLDGIIPQNYERI
ncbi:MAG: (2Fe-2S) ferredoxin domain-containing protein [Prevotellaceae bacterium]|jgi:NADP-reducing hydrogenase subunit HndB|nr:(2Fe-2S) ferredoxin domain-containing protein [Prevotellaceae bacterium]